MTVDRAQLLIYRVTGRPRIAVYENSALRVVIRDGLANFELKHDLPSLEAAERLVDEFLRSFEADEAFQGTEPVTFSFERGHMKSGAGKYVGLRGSLNVTGALAEANTRERTPWRRHDVASTPDAGALVQRYEAYRAGREALATVAYVVLSTVQERAGGRAKAAKRFLIGRDVLDRIGHLSSDRGDLASARKIDDRSTRRPLTQDDMFWLEAATRILIIRLHDLEVGVARLNPIEMSDLPR